MSAIGGMALSIAGNAANQAISQWINYGFQKKLMGKQYKYEEKLAQNAYNRQLDFWDMQNKYDDPGSQMLRLREAGLNPGMLNGQLGNTSNNLSSVSSGNVSTPPSGPAPGKFDVMQIMLQDENIKNLAADTAVKREEAENKRLLNIQEAIRANDFPTYYQLTKDKMIGEKKLNEAQEEYYRNLAKKAFDEARSAAVAADNAEGAAAAGINPIIDDHNVKTSETALNEANTNTVNALRDHLVEVQKATADSLKASASLAREQCNKTKEETEKLSDEDKKRTWDVTIGQFFGLADISVLSPELQAKAAEYYWDFQHGKYNYESTISAFQDQVNRYVEKNGHIVQSTSGNSTMGIKIGPISGNASAGKSVTY